MVNTVPQSGGDSTNICYSYKHAGLYLHIGRLLRPIWKKKCIVPTDGDSSISNFDCAHILDDLYGVKSFIDTFSMNNMSNYIGQHSEQAMTEEKRSIEALALFISKLNSEHCKQRIEFLTIYFFDKFSFSEHACEVIGLWKILCEHQFPTLFRS